jgi:hypothetical protein
MGLPKGTESLSSRWCSYVGSDGIHCVSLAFTVLGWFEKEKSRSRVRCSWEMLSLTRKEAFKYTAVEQEQL